jgi:hypothetical protein
MNLTSKAKSFWTDDHGFIISAELVIIATILVIGLVVGLSEVQTAVVHELNDVSCAIGRLNQSYFIRGFTGCKSATFGTFFTDMPDVCDGFCNADLCSGSGVWAGEGVGFGGGSFSGGYGGGMIYGGSGSGPMIAPATPAPVGPVLAPPTSDCITCPTNPAPAATAAPCDTCPPANGAAPKADNQVMPKGITEPGPMMAPEPAPKGDTPVMPKGNIQPPPAPAPAAAPKK